MMGIDERKIPVWLLWAACCLLPAVPSARAADCGAILAELEGMTGLMQRQQLLERIIADCQDDYRITHAYAYNLERLRRYEQALHYYELSIRLKPDFARSYFGMGDVYLVLGNRRAAQEALKKGLSLEPDNVWAQRSYQKALQPGEGGSSPAAAAAADEQSPLPVKDSPPSSPGEAGNGTVAQLMIGDREDAHDGGGSEQPLVMQIQFAMSSGELTAEVRETLDRVVCPALQSAEVMESRFEVAGHTDDSGLPEYNKYLAQIRARQVRDYLVEHCGIAAERLAVVSYGQERPAYPNTTRQNRIRNRRVEIRPLP